MPDAYKRSLNETEICDQFISPAIRAAGWTQSGHVRREYGFTNGRVIVRGKIAVRGKRKRADYLLFYEPNLPLAIVEAKDNTHPVGGGMQQAIAYAESLDVPFVFSSNGDAFLFHDRTGRSDPIERQLGLDEFPSPDELWERYRAWKGLTTERGARRRYPYHEDASGKEPRYYQRVAIQRAVEAIAARPATRPARDVDRHGQDLHGVPDHLAAVEGGQGQARARSSPTATSSSTRRSRTTSSRSGRS